MEPADSNRTCFGTCRDIKLREAEKVIANKDVLIKMLQQHVSKLEQSYKRNLNESENYRYKYRVAVEQIKRLRNTCGAAPQNESANLRSHLNKWKQQCDALTIAKERCSSCPGKHSYMQQIQNVEKVMKAHYELLNKLVNNVADKEDEYSVDGEIVEVDVGDSAEINNLRKEVERLKEEKRKLEDQLSDQDPLIPTIKDSVITALQKKMSTLEQKQVLTTLSSDSSDDYDRELRRVSFVGKPSFNNNTTAIVKEIIEEEVEKVLDMIETEIPSKDRKTSNNTIDSHSLKVPNNSKNEAVTESTSIINTNLETLFTKFIVFTEKMDTIATTQIETNKNVNELKEEITNNNNNEKILNLVEKINDQSALLTTNLTSQNEKIEKLVETTDKVQQQLNSLEAKLEAPSDDKTSSNSDVEEVQPSESCPINDLEQESLQKDRKIKCLTSLINYYQMLHQNIIAMYPEMSVILKANNFSKDPCCGETLEDYVERVHEKNCKMKTTISSVIDHLNKKMTHLKSMQDEEACQCDNRYSELEIEDVYNVVRQTFLPQCHNAESGSNHNCCVCSKDVYTSAHDCNYCLTNHEQYNHSEEIDQTVRCKTRNVTRCSSQIKECNKMFEPDNCPSGNLVSNLESYISYLHEQLDIISNIEHRIEDMRKDVKTT